MFMVWHGLRWHHFGGVMSTGFVLVRRGTMTGGWATIHTASSIWHNVVVDFFAYDCHLGIVLLFEVQIWGMRGRSPPRIPVFGSTIFRRLKGGFQFGGSGRRSWVVRRRLGLFCFV